MSFLEDFTKAKDESVKELVTKFALKYPNESFMSFDIGIYLQGNDSISFTHIYSNNLPIQKNELATFDAIVGLFQDNIDPEVFQRILKKYVKQADPSPN